MKENYENVPKKDVKYIEQINTKSSKGEEIP
jgi:hypothetical protein